MSTFAWMHLFSITFLVLLVIEIGFALGAYWERRKWKSLISDRILPEPYTVWYSESDVERRAEEKYLAVPTFIRDEYDA